MSGLLKEGPEEGKVWVWVVYVKVSLWEVQNLLVLKGMNHALKECLQLALFKLRYYMRWDGEEQGGSKMEEACRKAEWRYLFN